jgi:cation diffusion facilitator CzcD-associated flavoprotein CzcO
MSEAAHAHSTSDEPPVDVVVIGAGFGGLRALHDLRELGLSVTVLEAGTDVGGTWYWNRYPGARTDSESWVYCYSFDDDLLQEWNWSERFPPQPEVERYLHHVVERYDLRRDIRFERTVSTATFDEQSNRWTVTTDRGERLTSTYLICATGLMSAAYEPPFPGIESFRGEAYMTARWPKEPVDLTGKRVGVVGTGATAVQLIPVVAQTAGEVTVFQRTPNYVLPARNHPLDDAQRQAIKSDYDAIWEQVRGQAFAFPMESSGRVAADVSPEEQQRILEGGWETGGFRYIFETFDDVFLDEACNEAASEFVRGKIRAIVHDPETAELLCPKDYPLVAKRPPLGHFYYEAFNRDNVALVDVSDNPIEQITPTGLRTQTDAYEFDVIIFATGFDAVTGAMSHMDIRGRDGQTIAERWEAGPRTHLGIAVDGFPNMFMISGPQSPFANIPPVIEHTVEWIAEAVAHMREGGYDRIEATPEAVDAWAKHLTDLVNMTVVAKGERVHSWFFGTNIPGKSHAVLLYFGGANNYFAACRQAAEAGFEGFALTSSETEAAPAAA